MKRPKDMTNDELEALPILPSTDERNAGIIVFHYDRDDIMSWIDKNNNMWGFQQLTDGWYKRAW